MWAQIACEALSKGKCLELSYDGFTRVVEVHAVGITTKGNEGMSVWQVRGGSNSDERVGWKLMLCNEARAAVIIDEESQAPRSTYQGNAKSFDRIFCEIPPPARARPRR